MITYHMHMCALWCSLEFQRSGEIFYPLFFSLEVYYHYINFSVGGAWAWLFQIYAHIMGVISGQFSFCLVTPFKGYLHGKSNMGCNGGTQNRPLIFYCLCKKLQLAFLPHWKILNIQISGKHCIQYR